MRELSEDYGAPRDYDASEPDRVPSRLGCMIGAALCGLSAMVTVALIAWMFFTLTAHAHDAKSGWSYPIQCCSGVDCDEIPDKAVTEGPAGYRVQLQPGDHPFVKHSISFLIPYGTEKPAPDGKNHICLTMDMKLLCFFTGSKGF